MDDLARFAQQPYRFIARYLRRHFWAHAAIGVAVVLAVTCSVSTQYAVKYLVDALASVANHDKVWIGFVLLVALISADNVLWRVASAIGNSAFVDVTVSARRELLEHLTGHAQSYFVGRNPGALTSRITSTSNAIYAGETMVTFNVVPPLIATLVSIGYVATVSVPMSLGLAAVGAIIVAVIFHLASCGKPLHHAYAHTAATVDGEMTDLISNMSLVRSFGRAGSEHRRIGRALGRERVTRKRSLFYLEKLRILHAVTTSVLTFALLAWAIVLWQAGKATPGDVVLVCTLGVAVLSATRDLAVALVDVTQHFARLSESLRTLLQPHELRPCTGAMALESACGNVEFRGVQFSYSDAHPVIEDLSFTVGSGERIGIVGPSGSGKSTIFALMQRFYDVQGGQILLDGKQVRDLTTDTLRKSIALVAQDVALFHRSLRENIAYGRPNATDEEIWEAAVAARCDGFISSLPQGLDTIVGDRGAKLSGGQRQRVAIARAFLKDAPILLLDEATSALDAQSEEMIREALTRLMQGRTVMAIAHRLSSLKGFTRIIVVENGAVVQDGRPEVLIGKGGPYRALVELEMSRLKGLRHAA